VATFGVSGVLDVGELFGLVRGTGWGTGWLLQAAGLALVVGGLAHARRSGGGMGWRAAAAGAGLIAIGMALSGHAAAAPMVGLALLSAAVHVLAASAWLGTLLVVLAAGIPALHRGPGGEGVRGTAALVRAFSGAAVVCAAVVVLTGVINASFELGTLGALWSSAYGRMLLLKLALLVPVALLGGYNRWRVVPAIEGAGGAARMQRTAAVELAFAALVLLATAVLVATPTPLE
jgi:putative copper export protein